MLAGKDTGNWFFLPVLAGGVLVHSTYDDQRFEVVDPGTGALVDDFKISETPDAIHVLNAPSPAATASLAIGKHIAALAGKSFGLGSS